MDVFSLLSNINKISLLVFFITALVVGYQIYILKKERNKGQTPLIPDFKEKNNFNETVNFTSLPASLIKEKTKTFNYSKLIFLIISLLTVMIIIFVIFLVNKNDSSRNTPLNNTSAIRVTKTPPEIKPTSLLTPTPEQLPTTADIEITPTIEPEATVIPTAEPTEIILASNPSLTPEAELTEAPMDQIETLPETGSWTKGFLLIGVAISTIFFSFWL